MYISCSLGTVDLKYRRLGVKMKWRFPMNASKFHLILLSPEAKAASGRCSFRGRGRGSGKPHRGPGRRDEDSLGFSTQML